MNKYLLILMALSVLGQRVEADLQHRHEIVRGCIACSNTNCDGLTISVQSDFVACANAVVTALNISVISYILLGGVANEGRYSFIRVMYTDTTKF